MLWDEGVLIGARSRSWVMGQHGVPYCICDPAVLIAMGAFGRGQRDGPVARRLEASSLEA